MFWQMYTYLWMPIVGLFFGLGIVLLVRSVTAPRWMNRVPSCGGCGYELGDLGGWTCPECGAKAR